MPQKRLHRTTLAVLMLLCSWLGCSSMGGQGKIETASSIPEADAPESEFSLRIHYARDWCIWRLGVSDDDPGDFESWCLTRFAKSTVAPSTGWISPQGAGEKSDFDRGASPESPR
jgi:hypothetical protein